VSFSKEVFLARNASFYFEFKHIDIEMRYNIILKS